MTPCRSAASRRPNGRPVLVEQRCDVGLDQLEPSSALVLLGSQRGLGFGPFGVTHVALYAPVRQALTGGHLNLSKTHRIPLDVATRAEIRPVPIATSAGRPVGENGMALAADKPEPTGSHPTIGARLATEPANGAIVIPVGEHGRR